MHAVLIAVYLLVAGTVAGFISAIAGLASLISYPVLLSIGVPPVSANVTNTAALIFTGLGSTMASGKELHGHRRIMWHVSIVAMAGGVIGCLILAYAPSASFEKIVPFLIFGAGVAMLVSGRQAVKKQTAQSDGLIKQGLKNGAIFLVGIYIGYFGAAAGIFLLSILTVTLTTPFVVSNAIKNFTSFTTNILSLIIYAFTTKVYWLLAIPLAVGMFIGGYMGPIAVRHVPVKLTRTVISIAAMLLGLYLFYSAYFK